MKISLQGILRFLQDQELLSREVAITAESFITAFSPLTETVSGSMTWFKYTSWDWNSVKATAVIVPVDFVTPTTVAQRIIFIPVKNPRQTFAKVVAAFYPQLHKKGIEPTARVGRNCVIGKDVYIGHYTVIGDDVEIGDDTVIYGHVAVYDRIRIGSRCVINSGTVIGADGFGYEKDDDGQYFKFPHIGSVVIEDDVEIGSNTSIDRGVLGNTLIQENAKIDNLCHIAHNVVVGKNSMVIAHAMLGGSVTLGSNTWIAPSAVIKNGLDIGDESVVGLGAVVLKNVPENDIVAGIPAKSIKK
ncbi:MAG: UDP-3-O-(3-hydroxymyristoyl)glucosamine N-acyltransferase [Sporomusaceae bacterium]|nr:UDP-3-O-(3-hydroxymyristoyl)glucosamine N-acyltransferase [Sporomusaceae bacterium]